MVYAESSDYQPVSSYQQASGPLGSVAFISIGGIRLRAATIGTPPAALTIIMLYI